MHSYSATVLWVLALLLCGYVPYYLYTRQSRKAAQQQIIAKYGCKPGKTVHSRYPFGLDILQASIRSVREHKGLEKYQSRFRELDCHTHFSKFLGVRMITTMEPDNIKAVLATDFKSYSVGEDRKKSLRPILGDGIFNSDGAAWQHSRELLRPCFVRSQIGDIILFEKHFKRLLHHIPRDGSTVNLQSIFFDLTLDIATEFLFGESTNSLVPDKRRPEDDRFVEAFTYVQNTVDAKTGLLSLFLPDPKFRRSCKYIHEYVDALIERSLTNRSSNEKEKDSSQRYTLLYELAKYTSDKITMRTELLSMLLAGRDTTASLLSNAWWSISRNPAIFDRLRQEVAALETPLGEERPLFEELKDMKYLRAVLNESLRLHPVVPANSRQAITDTTLPLGGGADGKSPVFIPKGAIVGYGVYAMHRRQDLYGEDAEEFKPERWLDQDGKKGLRPGWEYLPFNGGPRICIGRKSFQTRIPKITYESLEQFALTEASYISVRLVQEFARIESRDSEPWREKLSLTCTGLGGCKVSLTAQEH
ncbi:MAG: hypothetical protein Q9174_006669 [Haloplaca sp. 1 TL-2023]